LAAAPADEAVAADAQQQADEDGVERPDTVRLRQRAAPFIEMLRRSVAEEHDVVWGA
jgi:cyclopropane-fatty-acyl-phospholipid synthase